MNRMNFKKYVSYVKEKRRSNIEDYYIEKDYFISLFLSTWQELKNDEKLPHLNTLIFKGGTLLSRNYLDYPRISEDLDFTYEESNTLREVESKHKREKAILTHIIPIIDEIKLLCDKGNFLFEIDRTNPKYIIARNSRAVYILHVYYHSMIHREEIPIKLEINFLEQRFHDYKKEMINNIVHHDLRLRSMGYNLLNINVKTYRLDEIIIEKYRAILTRDVLKERDIFDLYLIDKRCKHVLTVENSLICKKIESGKLISQVLSENLKHNCMLLHNDQFGDSDDDIARLSLIDIQYKDYNKFKNHLYEKLKNICNLIKQA